MRVVRQNGEQDDGEEHETKPRRQRLAVEWCWGVLGGEATTISRGEVPEKDITKHSDPLIHWVGEADSLSAKPAIL